MSVHLLFQSSESSDILGFLFLGLLIVDAVQRLQPRRIQAHPANVLSANDTRDVRSVPRQHAAERVSELIGEILVRHEAKLGWLVVARNCVEFQ